MLLLFFKGFYLFSLLSASCTSNTGGERATNMKIVFLHLEKLPNQGGKTDPSGPISREKVVV